MGRILAIDYGLKRCGLAVTDETKAFAFGLTTVATPDLKKFLLEYTNANEVDGFVVGEPKTLDNKATHSTSHVKGFVKRLQADFPGKEIHMMDERFTSSLAKQSIIDSGIKKKGRQDKNMVDMVSATIILQSWIEYMNNSR